MNNNRHTALSEKMQEIMRQRCEAGSIANRFPQVASIVVNMTYTQIGARPILRTFQFTPSSDAFFLVNCLRRDCVDGGFDLTDAITAMVKNRKVGAKGALSCQGTDSSTNHSDIVYEIAVQYA